MAYMCKTIYTTVEIAAHMPIKYICIKKFTYDSDKRSYLYNIPIKSVASSKWTKGKDKPSRVQPDLHECSPHNPLKGFLCNL